MSRNKVRPRDTASANSLLAGKAGSVKDIPTEETLLFSFKHLDKNQGQTFEEWQINVTWAVANGHPPFAWRGLEARRVSFRFGNLPG